MSFAWGKAWKHFRTVSKHRRLVRRNCFRVGLYWQGLVHDLSKYSPTEFRVGIKYYQGDRSPNNAEREDIGYSTAWMHHKGRNRHHYEYWIDYNTRGRDPDQPIMIPVEMPDRYLAEMIMDRIAASRVYRGDAYRDDDPLKYLQQGIERVPMHPETLRKLEYYLTMLAERGEEETFRVIKRELVKQK